MTRLFDMILGVALSTAGLSDAVRERLAEPPDLVFGRADADTALKSQVLLGIIGKEHYDWSVDLDDGTIKFTTRTRVISAPVQVIGTYNTLDGTFLWGWEHPSVPKARAADAQLAHLYGQRNRLPLFTTRKVECTEDQAWRFTAVALYLAGAQGAYRGPYGTTMVFMTFGTIKISPRK